jgi:hypothetical protein
MQTAYIKMTNIIKMYYIQTMPKIYLMDNNILMANNNGWDKDKIPFVPFDEWLGDCSWQPENAFKTMCRDIMDDEVKILPKHMKKEAIKIIVDWLKNFDDKRRSYLEETNQQPY